jgi:hypothetical protein
LIINGVDEILAVRGFGLWLEYKSLFINLLSDIRQAMHKLQRWSDSNRWLSFLTPS